MHSGNARSVKVKIFYTVSGLNRKSYFIAVLRNTIEVQIILMEPNNNVP